MRIRTIKPEFWHNEDLAKLSEFSRLLAIALLNYADDQGFFQATPALMRGELFPFDEDSSRIQRALGDLSRIDYVRLYTGTNGRLYGQIVNFTKHQKIDRPSASKIEPLVNFDEDSTSPQRALALGTGNREQGNGTGNREHTAQGGGEVLTVAEESVKPPKPNKTPLQIRAGRLYRQRDTTPFDSSENRAWKNNRQAVEATTEEQWKALEAFHSFQETDRHKVYPAQKLATALNNWNGEISKAVDFVRNGPKLKPGAPYIANERQARAEEALMPPVYDLDGNPAEF